MEDIRIQLANQPDFNLMDAFNMLDYQGKGRLTAPELGEVLADLGHFFHKDHLYLFVRRFDRQNDGCILYSDFCDAITPLSLPHSTLLNSRRALFIH